MNNSLIISIFLHDPNTKDQELSSIKGIVFSAFAQMEEKSGCAGKTKWGLELFGLAVLDISRRTAFHLFCFQTVDLTQDETLISFYVRKPLEKKEDLLKLSKYMIADAYFSKITFVEPFVDSDFSVVSRLRDDANLHYLFEGEQKKGRGRGRKYDGKIDFKTLDICHWSSKKSQDIDQKIPFSMANIKTQYHNQLLLNRFITMFGINPELDKNKAKISQLRDFGKITA